MTNEQLEQEIKLLRKAIDSLALSYHERSEVLFMPLNEEVSYNTNLSALRIDNQIIKVTLNRSVRKLRLAEQAIIDDLMKIIVVSNSKLRNIKIEK